MTKPCEGKCDNARRGFLQTALAVVAAVPFLGLTVRPSKAAKISKASVAYKDSPNGSHSCDNCRLFEPPKACKLVEGAVSPQGWCRMWSAKG